MAVRQRGGSWQADFMVKGRRFRETFDDKTRAEAWELLAKAHLKRWQEPPKPEAEDRPASHSEGSLRSIYATLEETRWKKQPRSYRTSMVTVKSALYFFRAVNSLSAPAACCRDPSRAAGVAER